MTLEAPWVPHCVHLTKEISGLPTNLNNLPTNPHQQSANRTSPACVFIFLLLSQNRYKHPRCVPRCSPTVYGDRNECALILSQDSNSWVVTSPHQLSAVFGLRQFTEGDNKSKSWDSFGAFVFSGYNVKCDKAGLTKDASFSEVLKRT